MDQARETAGTTMRLIVDYVRRQGGEAAVRRLLAAAGEERPLSVVEDERVWSSYAAKLALLEAAVTVTGQPDAAVRIGEGALDSQVGGSLKLLLGLVGSPGQLVRGIARVNNKFSTAADMTAVSVHAGRAVIRYRVRDGYPPSAHDCGYTRGLLSQVPAIFGLPAARVRHEDCQVHGAEACVYELAWQERPARLRLRRRLRARSASALSPGLSPATVDQRLRDLQETVAELVAGRSVDEVLRVVTEHARATVGAQRFLLVTHGEDGREPDISADGFTTDDAARVADRLLADEAPGTGEHVLVAPVRSLGRDYGRLAAFGRSAFFDHEEELLRSYASLAATALDAITALDEARDRQHVAEVLLRFARALLETRDRRDVARTTAEAAVSLAVGDTATVMLYDEWDRDLSVAASVGWPEDLAGSVERFRIVPTDTPELDQLVSNPDEARVYDRESVDPYIREVLERFRCSHVLVIPLRSAARLWGVMITAWLDRAEAPRPQGLIPRLSGLADQAVAALERAELTEQVHRQATTDTLTGLANRATFSHHLEQWLTAPPVHAGAGPGDRPGVGVIFLDLDSFKEVNDSLGHTVGDELLCVVARRLHDLVREDDLVARLGGDEFTLLLPGLESPRELADCAARIVRAFDDPVALAGRLLQVRPSVGAVLVDPSHASVKDVLRSADAAMYAAKKGGGGRYVLHGADELGAGATASWAPARGA